MAAQCHAAINQYRAKAGLDNASSTSIKALAVAAGKHAAYRVNVDPGDSILLSALGLPDLGLFGPDLNAHLETPSLVGLGFTGVNPWDRTRAAQLGQRRLALPVRGRHHGLRHPRGQPPGRPQLDRRPLPPAALLDANTRHVGCAASQRQLGATVYSAEVLEMAATWKDTTKRITLSPAPARPASQPPSTAARSTRPPSAAAATPPARPSPSAT